MVDVPTTLFGRVGSLNETTGLFALEGHQDAFQVPQDVIDAVSRTREGCEFGSGVPFRTEKDAKIKFFNQLPGYCRTSGQLVTAIKSYSATGDLGPLTKMPQSLIYNFLTTKVSPRVYNSETIGIVPEHRMVKVILREKDIATKRVLLFATNVPPELGGKTWLVSPHGFTWLDTPKYIIAEGEKIDFQNAVQNPTFLFMGLTNAVPFISGHRHRSRDEEHPRILWSPISDNHGQHLTDEFKTLVDNIPTSSNGYTLAELTYAMAEEGMQAIKEGKAKPKVEKLAEDTATVDLTDNDLMW